MKVHEIMTAHARSVAPDTRLLEAAGMMRQLDVGALPVCDGDEIAGIVTDRDMVVRALADGRDGQTLVSDVMSGGVVSVRADAEVEEAVRLMEQHQVRRVPVTDRAGKVIGIVSLGDVATSSNAAFGGMALRDVSEPNEPSARRRRLEQKSALPSVPGARRGPSGRASTRSTVGSSQRRGAQARSGRSGARDSTKSARSARTSKSAGRSRKKARR